MIEVQLGPGSLSKARVWLEAPPSLDVPAETARIERTVPAPARAGSRREVGVELYVPIGPKIDTALLVATYVPDEGKELRLQVVATSPDGPAVEWALAASKFEIVRAGLPREYADSIAGAASAEAQRFGLGAGVLRFDRAAHGLVGSSPRIFARCAKLVVRLLAAPLSALTPENLTNVFRYEWTREAVLATDSTSRANETTASFRAFHVDLDPSEVTTLLGIEPSFSIKRGQERTRTTKKGKLLNLGIAKEGGWMLETPLPRSVTLEEHLHALLDRLEPVAMKVALLREREYRLDFYCGYFQWSGQCGPQFSPSLLSRLARFRVTLDVDIFGAGGLGRESDEDVEAS